VPIDPIVVEAILVLIILVLLAIILFSGGGVFRVRKLSSDIDRLRGEMRRLQAVNESLRENIDSADEKILRSFNELITLVRELENVEMALAGSSSIREQLVTKYGVGIGPEMVDAILARSERVDPATKERLVKEILVGDAGRALLRSMSSGATIDRAAADAGLPTIVAKNQIRGLQILGYLDDRMELTSRGRDALR
jgi:hypothetical protein